LEGEYSGADGAVRDISSGGNDDIDARQGTESGVDGESDTGPDAEADVVSNAHSGANPDAGADGDSDTGSDGDADNDSDTNTHESFNICNEDVPSENHVDGIPAYAQCPESNNSGIWSNDGVGTSTDRLGSDWVRTQWGAGYQCTEYASRYLKFKWGVMGVPNGNAGSWCEGSPPDGLVQTDTPVHGDIMVFAPGSCWASSTYGHVVVVDVVNESRGSVEFVEQNPPGRRSCAIDTAACYLHAVENTE
jgi:surface antigen